MKSKSEKEPKEKEKDRLGEKEKERTEKEKERDRSERSFEKKLKKLKQTSERQASLVDEERKKARKRIEEKQRSKGSKGMQKPGKRGRQPGRGRELQRLLVEKSYFLTGDADADLAKALAEEYARPYYSMYDSVKRRSCKVTDKDRQMDSSFRQG